MDEKPIPYFTQRTNEALTGIECVDGKMLARLRYQVEFVLKLVARDVRHEAIEKLNDCSRQIMNMDRF